MPKRTEDETYHWLWFEALRLSNEYREVCEWDEKSSEPPEELNWSLYPYIKETYLRMGNVFLLSFDDWLEQRKLIDDVVTSMYANMKVHPLDLREIIDEGLNLFKNDFIRDFDSAKNKFLARISDLYGEPEDLVIKIDTELLGEAKEVRSVIESLIVEKRGKNKQERLFMADDITKYLNFYRVKMKLKPSLGEGISQTPPISTLNRYLRFGERIVINATRGVFPGKYTDS